jgi:hypothetical protein
LRHSSIRGSMIGPQVLCNRDSTAPRPHGQGTEHRFPKPFRRVLRTKGKRLKVLLRLRFRLSSSRIISHVLTPLAAQVRPKHGPEIPPRQVTRFILAPRPASRSVGGSTLGTTCDAEAPSLNTNHRSNERPSTITTLKPWPMASVSGHQGELHLAASCGRPRGVMGGAHRGGATDRC